MSAHDQASAASMIARFGGACKLRRSGVDRDCVAGQLEYSPRDENLRLRGIRRYLVAAPLDVPPDHEQDQLIAFGEVLNLIAPVKGPRPDGNFVFYDLLVEYVEAA